MNFIAVLIALAIATLSQVAVLGQEGEEPSIGKIISPKGPVLELLQGARLDGNSSWVSVGKQQVDQDVLLSTETTYYEVLELAYSHFGVDGTITETYRRVSYPTTKTIKLISSSEIEFDVQGESDLLQILNRPLTGLQSNRMQESRITQMRFQLSDAISKGNDNGERIEVVTGFDVMKDPTIQVAGFASEEEVGRCLKKLFQESSLSVSSIERKSGGLFDAKLKGELTTDIRYRQVLESPPPSVFAAAFYFGSARIQERKNASSLFSVGPARTREGVSGVVESLSK